MSPLENYFWHWTISGGCNPTTQLLVAVRPGRVTPGPPCDQIARQALTLPPEDVAYVANALERSLDAGPFATPEIAEAWSKEIDRRLVAYVRSETEAVDVETSTKRLRENLKAHRSPKRTS